MRIILSHALLALSLLLLPESVQKAKAERHCRPEPCSYTVKISEPGCSYESETFTKCVGICSSVTYTAMANKRSELETEMMCCVPIGYTDRNVSMICNGRFATKTYKEIKACGCSSCSVA